MGISREIEVTAWDNPLDQLPADIRNALSDEDAIVYDQGTKYFNDIALACPYEPLARLFRKIGELEKFRLHLYGSRTPEYRVYFGFFFWMVNEYVKVRLPTAHQLPGQAPTFLRDVYRSTGGVLEHSACHIGWEAPEDVRTMAEAEFWTSDDEDHALDRCYLAFSYGDGDYVGYRDDGVGFLYNHEKGMLEDFDLESFASSYFGDYVNRNDA